MHRDVKPSNILVCANDFAYLIDFGIAHASEDRTLTKVGETIGTAAYLAPEAVSTAAKTHPRVDVYALACVLYECLTGKPPFSSDLGVQGLIAHHLYTPPPQPSANAPDVPAAFDAVIAKGMAKNPDDRYPTVQDLAEAARAALTDPEPIETPASTPGRRIHLSRRTIGAIVAAVAVVAVVTTAVLIIGLQSSGSGGVSPAPAAGGNGAQSSLPFTDVQLVTGIAVDAVGTAYVTDIGRDEVLRLAAGASTPTGLPISGLKNPRDVAVAVDGSVYVADSSNDRVLRLAAGATATTTLPFTGLNDPRGVAVESTGTVDVTDTGNNRVLTLPAGATAPTTLPFSGLNDPQGLTVDAEDNVYVTDRGNAGVLQLRHGATAATPLPFTGLTDPQGVAVDGHGDVYVTDAGHVPVVKLAVG